MSRQKSITSFFTKVVAKAADIVGENAIKENKSPLKAATGTFDIPHLDTDSKSPKQTELPSKKRRWNRLQSDSEASEDGDGVGASLPQKASVNGITCSPTSLETSSNEAKEDSSVETVSPRIKCRKIGELRSGFGANSLHPGIVSNKCVIFPSNVSQVCAFSVSGGNEPATTRNDVLETNSSNTETEKVPPSDKLSSQITGYGNCGNGITKNTGDDSYDNTCTSSKADCKSSPSKLESQVKMEANCVGTPDKSRSSEMGEVGGTKLTDNESEVLEANGVGTPVNCNPTETVGDGSESCDSKIEEKIPNSPDSKVKVEVNSVGSPVNGNPVDTGEGANGSCSPTTKSENKQITQKPKHQDKIEQIPDAKKEIHSFFAPRKSSNTTKKEKKSSPPKKSGAEQKSLPTKNTESDKSLDAGDRESNFDPSKKNYHPIKDAFWNRGDNVPYLALAKTLEEIEAVSARLKIIEILSNYLRSVIVLSPDDLLPSIYLCLNKLAPAYEGVELGIAETTLMKAIAQSTGRSVAQIKSDSAATGDLGIVAEQSRSNQRMMFQPAKLTVKSVFERIKEIAMMTGHASMSKKVDKIQSMFVACRHSEARYLIRSLAGKLRIGLAEQSVLQALALACATTPPEQAYPPEVLNTSKEMSAEAFKALVDECSLIVKTTYCECPNYNMIIPVLLKEGVAALPKHCRLSPGIPLKPMLAHPTKGVHEVLQRFDGQKFTCEWKYDGERAQIHLHEDKSVSIYSRNQENNTSKYPDVIGRLSKALGPNVTSCILDCEAVAWDKEKKQILPFQILSTRKRKDANESEIKVAVCVFMFDLLYLNGRALVKETLMERRQLLRDNFLQTEGEFIFATNLDTSTMDEVQNFLEDAVKGNCEGLMVKTLETEATYEIAKRSRNWLKLKKDYLEGVGDTIDVVVIGGYLGRGKRTGAYGGFLLACYDPDNEEYQSLCKIGTGFSDESLQQHSEFFKDNIIKAPRPYYRYDSSHEPDHWFDAVQVWEIKCADLSLSPVHRAALGIVDPEKGISLRFPRFLRVRDDKAVEDATSASEVAELYNKQDQVKNQQSSSKVAEEDFY